MSNNAALSTEKVLVSVRKATDLDLRVRIVKVDEVEVVELRDYIPSLEEYGRGYWMPSDRETINAVVQALLLASSEVSR